MVVPLTSTQNIRGIQLTRAVKKSALKRRPGACGACKRRKVRCNGALPCTQCIKYANECVYDRRSRTSRTLSLDLSCSPLAPASTQISGSEAPSSDESHRLSTPQSIQDSCQSHSSIHSPGSGWERLVSYGDSSDWGQLPLNDKQRKLPQNILSNSDDAADLTLLPPLQFEVDLDTSCPDGLFGSAESLAAIPSEIHVASSINAMPLSLWESLGTSPLPAPETVEPQSATVRRRVSVKDRTIFQYLQSILSWRPNLESLLHSDRSKPNCDGVPCKRMMCDRVEACFGDSRGIKLFLERIVVENAIDQVFEKNSENLTLQTLTSAVNGLGIWYQGIESTDTRVDYLADCCRILDINVSNSSRIVFADQSLLALQTQVVLVHLSIMLSSRYTATLLAFATQHVRALGLHSDQIITSRFTRFDDQQCVRRTLWSLFAVEKSFCMSEKIPSFFDHKAIDHGIRDIADTSSHHQWLVIQHEYALICSSLLSTRLYGVSSGCKTCEQPEDLEHIYQQLSSWKVLIPYDIDTHLDLSLQTDKSERKTRLVTFMMYHEAILSVFMVHKDCENNYKNIISSPDKMLQDAKRSAIAVLKCSSYLEHEDVLRHPTIYRIVCVAFCVVFESISRDSTLKQDLAYLAIAAGFFGKISLLVEVPLTEITELLRLAQQ